MDISSHDLSHPFHDSVSLGFIILHLPWLRIQRENITKTTVTRSSRHCRHEIHDKSVGRGKQTQRVGEGPVVGGVNLELSTVPTQNQHVCPCLLYLFYTGCRIKGLDFLRA